MNDIVGKAHLYNGVNYSYISRSNSITFSAIRLGSGFLQAPEGFYINRDFTISAWVRVNMFSLWARLIDLENTIVFTLFKNYEPTPVFICRPGRVESPTRLNYGQWYHIAATLEGNLGKIYLNGRLDARSVISCTTGLKTLINYVGKSNSNGNGLAFADIYDLKIYNRSLTNSEIIKYMN